jgi:uncharacterized delta-60 repeat protein
MLKKIQLVIIVLAFACVQGKVQAQCAGDIDQSFNYGQGANFKLNYGFGIEGIKNDYLPCYLNMGDFFGRTLDCFAILPDGKIIIGGRFFSYNGESVSNIARLNSDGTLNVSFDEGYEDYRVNLLAVQPDGKILVAGIHDNITAFTTYQFNRLNSDLSIDTSFQSVIESDYGYSAIALQPDGKILIAGIITKFGDTYKYYIARLHSNGNMDSSFHRSTEVTSEINSIIIQPDGKILIRGNTDPSNETSIDYISRLNSDGSLDNSFKPTIRSVKRSLYPSAALQSDGKILIVGDFTNYNGTPIHSIARLNVDGSLDSSFNSGTGAEGYHGITSIALQSDGKILIGGDFNSYNGSSINAIARLNTNGSLDTSLNLGTVATIDVQSIVLQPDGKILIDGGGGLNSPARLLSNGRVDTTFNPRRGANYYIYSTCQQPDGKILIGGNFSNYNGNNRNCIARLNTDGSLDNSFNPGIGANNSIYVVALQSNGKILIGGDFTTFNGTSRNHIARLNKDGSLDTSFNPKSAANDNVYSIVLQSDNKILIGGSFTSYNGTIRNCIARLNKDGSLDKSFNPKSAANYNVYSIVLQSDNKILIGGSFTSYNGTIRNCIARLNKDGSLDKSFNTSKVLGDSYCDDPKVFSIVLQPNQKILIGGEFTIDNRHHTNYIARLNANGSLDKSFNYAKSGADGRVITMALQSDGKILVAGNFFRYNKTNINYIARLNSNGRLDTSFKSLLEKENCLLEKEEYLLEPKECIFVSSVIIQKDNKIIIGGNFDRYNGYSTPRICRLIANDSIEIIKVEQIKKVSTSKTKLSRQNHLKLIIKSPLPPRLRKK